MKIRNKLICGFLIIALVLGASLSVAVIRNTNKNMERIDVYRQHEAISIAKVLDGSINSEDDIKDINYAQFLINGIVAADPKVKRISIITEAPAGKSPSGYWFVASSAAPRIGRQADPEDVEAIKNDKIITLVEASSETPLEKELTVDLTYPLHDEEGKSIAVAGITLFYDVSVGESETLEFDDAREKALAIGHTLDSAINSKGQLTNRNPAQIKIDEIVKVLPHMSINIIAEAPEGKNMSGYWFLASSLPEKIKTQADQQDVEALKNDKMNVLFKTDENNTRYIEVMYPLHDLMGNAVASAEITISLKEEDVFLAEKNKELISESMSFILIVLIVGLIIALGLGFFISISISGPITKLKSVALDIAKGNLDAKIDIRSKDEIGELADTFNKMTWELQRTTVSKQTLQSILESMPYSIVLIGMDKKILNANHAALEMMGYESKEQIAGLICNTMLCLTEDFKCPIIDLKQKVDRSEKILITKDGRHIPILKSVVPFKLGDRQVLLEAFIDISERKRAEETLRQSEEKHRMLIENIQDGVFIIQDRVLQFVNEAFARMIGYSMEEVAGRDFREFIAPEDQEMVLDRYQRRLAGENVAREYEFRMLHKDGKTRIFVNINVGLIDYRGRNASMGTIKDITELKRAEEIRHENERLALMSRAKAEFLLNMSHELRTPLNSILGFSELLKMNVNGELNKKQARYVDNVITSGSNLIRLIDDILELIRAEAGEMEMKIEKISVPSLMDDSLLLIKENAAAHNVIIEKDLDLQLEFIDADRHKVKQVLYNLLSNAVKFSKPGGGTVTIITRQEGRMAKISISDTGIGIKEEDMGRLFRTFEQLDSGITRKYGGTGLGLAISKKLVELHGGTLTVRSRYGEGSTFTFCLPIKGIK